MEGSLKEEVDLVTLWHLIIVGILYFDIKNRWTNFARSQSSIVAI